MYNTLYFQLRSEGTNLEFQMTHNFVKFSFC